jgi:hypothetical protein
MGILGVGIMNLMAFSLLANSNSKVDGNQISFGIVDFQLHPPTLTPVFASLDQMEKIQELDETMDNLDLGDQSEDFMICCDDISDKSTDTWKT